MCAWQTPEMPTFSHQHPKSITLCVDQSLEWKMLAKWLLTEVRHMAHFWMSYGRCTMPGSPMGRSEGLPRRWTG